MMILLDWKTDLEESVRIETKLALKWREVGKGINMKTANTIVIAITIATCILIGGCASSVQGDVASAMNVQEENNNCDDGKSDCDGDTDENTDNDSETEIEEDFDFGACSNDCIRCSVVETRSNRCLVCEDENREEYRIEEDGTVCGYPPSVETTIDPTTGTRVRVVIAEVTDYSR